MQLVFYILCMRVLWHDRRPGRRQYFLMIYSTILCCTTLITWIIASRDNMIAFINDRNYPGGPIAFVESPTSGLRHEDIVAQTSLVLGNILADGLLVRSSRS